MRKISFMLLLALLFTSCGEGDDAPARRASSPSASPPPPPVCPLTGVDASSRELVERPALAVKIENSVSSRPQAGLEQADIVYEELAEGGITRFLAVFHCSDAESLGPIRSARLVDPDILREYVPVLFAYSGGNPLVKDKVEATDGIVNLRHGSHGDAYKRKSGRKAPHNLFSTSADLRGLEDAATAIGSPEIGFVFDPEALPGPCPTASPAKGSTKNGSVKDAQVVPGCVPASSGAGSPAPTPPAGASVSFSFAGSQLTKFVYDSAAKAYSRFHGETAHVAENGSQLRAVNVVILKVEVTEGNIRDAAGNASPEIAVVGAGEAIVLRGGIATTGTWNRTALSKKTTLTNGGGKPIALLPGNTWIELVPEGRPVTVK
jgi:hypothetical protein